MSRSFYDIDPAGEVLCTYTESGERETLRAVCLNLDDLLEHDYLSLSGR
jgi:hypothetical protein